MWAALAAALGSLIGSAGKGNMGAIANSVNQLGQEAEAYQQDGGGTQLGGQVQEDGIDPQASEGDRELARMLAELQATRQNRGM